MKVPEEREKERLSTHSSDPMAEDGVGLIVNSYWEPEAHRGVDAGPRPNWNRSWTAALRRPQDQPYSLWGHHGAQLSAAHPESPSNVHKCGEDKQEHDPKLAWGEDGIGVESQGFPVPMDSQA